MSQNDVATTLNLRARSYPIYVGVCIVDRLGEIISKYIQHISNVTIVTSHIIDELYGERVTRALTEYNPSKSIVPEGEDAKTWDVAGNLIGEFLENDLDRKSVVIALGGGAVGDLAGFAASIYLRGIKVVQIPTTLLGQVDSSIGGKTAVNHRKGKNLIGSFHQPSIVVSDTSLLSSLPLREIKSGLGEIVKHGVIADQALFKEIGEKADQLLQADPYALADVVKKNARIKAQFVQQDERETTGIRAALNYGHTLGHAVEKHFYPAFRHGEAVSIGMRFAAKLGVRLGTFKDSDEQRQSVLLKKLDLVSNIPRVEPEKLIELMKRDKKAESGKIRFVLPTGIGSMPELRTMKTQVISDLLEELL